MRPNFPLKNMALSDLIRFQEAKFIFQYTEFIRTKDPNEENLINMDIHLIVLELDNMEDELNQTIHTTNDLTKTILFEELKENIRDFSLFEINKHDIRDKINKWNEEKYISFMQEVEKGIEEYFLRPERAKYKHLEEYKGKHKVHQLLGWGTPISALITYTNYNFYCVENTSQLIDDKYLDDYYIFLEFVLSKFREKVKPLMKLYDEGKISSSKKTENFYDRSVNWFKNNKIVASLIIFVVAGTAILAFVNQLKDTADRFYNKGKIETFVDSVKLDNNEHQMTIDRDTTEANKKDTLKSK